MSFQTKIQKIPNALLTIDNLQIFHYFAPSNQDAPYVVWAEEDEGNSLHTDNKKVCQAISGYIDFYTAEEFDETVDEIQNALNSIDLCVWRIVSILYGDPENDDDNLIHYTWYWTVG